jgi:hypothetical protein
LHVVAHPYATAAGDAQVPVELDIGVALVTASNYLCGRCRWRDLQRAACFGEFASGVGGEGVGRERGDDERDGVAT